MDDVGGRLSWSALLSFIHNLDTSSALARDIGKSTGWENTLRTNILLAEIIDVLQMINANIIGLGGKKKKIKPYPRPWVKDNDKKKVGKDPLPVNELRKWFEEKRNGRRKL